MERWLLLSAFHKLCLGAEPTGFEPAIFCVTGRHVRPLHHGSIFAWNDLHSVHPLRVGSYQTGVFLSSPFIHQFCLCFRLAEKLALLHVYSLRSLCYISPLGIMKITLNG